MTVTPDNSGRVATIRAVRGSTVLSDLSYTYSRLVGSTATDGVLTRSRVNNQATGTAGKTTTYGYDSLARLTSAVEKDTTGMTTTASWAYGYDPAGNRTSATLSPTGAVGTGDGVLSGGGAMFAPRPRLAGVSCNWPTSGPTRRQYRKPVLVVRARDWLRICALATAATLLFGPGLAVIKASVPGGIDLLVLSTIASASLVTRRLVQASQLVSPEPVLLRLRSPAPLGSPPWPAVRARIVCRPPVRTP